MEGSSPVHCESNTKQHKKNCWTMNISEWHNELPYKLTNRKHAHRLTTVKQLKQPRRKQPKDWGPENRHTKNALSQKAESLH
jgi:hypothetical protein